MPDFVLEIGTEEVPASAVVPALAQLRLLLEQRLRVERIGFREVRTLGTPRRLVALASGVADRQEDAEIEIGGPPARVAYDEAGNPTPAAEGFARKNQVSLADLEVRPTPRGDYVFAVRREEGRSSLEVLARVLPDIPGTLNFPKFMRWGEGQFRFVRPIRWILCLLGDQVVALEVEGIRSGRQTFGHRVLGAGPFEVPSADAYEETVRRGGVVLDPEERREWIVREGDALAEAEGLRIAWDPALLQEVTFVVEQPTAFLGRFSEEYLRLPRPVLVSAMRKHQRYFTVEDAEGGLAPRFLAVRNGGRQGLDVVRKGNERVLAFRFNDAVFYFDEDRKTTLAEKRERLKRIVFIERMGTVWDRSERLIRGIEALCRDVGAEERRAAATRAAELCKADLASQMVVELPELQGVMGREYALLEGEPPEVAEAIGEHYRPRGAGDAIPETALGRYLSLVDRLDTLAATFSLGLVPSGSFDPFGLRRQATGAVAILRELPDMVSLSALVERALATLGQVEGREPASARDPILALITGRMEAALEEAGVRGDLIGAALAAGANHVPSTFARARFIQERATVDPETFERIVTVATRVRNIVRPAAAADGDLARLEHPTEKQLAALVERDDPEVRDAIARGDWGAAWAVWDSVRPDIDRFFVDVLVMAEDPALRAARLSLLRRLDAWFLALADFSKVVSG